MNRDIIETSAPGKILWLGGYSVLERPNLGFVTTVDARVRARVKTTSGKGVRISAPQFGAAITGVLDAGTGNLEIAAHKELVLMKTCVEIATRYAVGAGHRVLGIDVEAKSDPAFGYDMSGTKRVGKSGLGSSAATAVATVGGILSAYGMDYNEDDALHKLAQLAHSVATGKVGSGFDVAAAMHGSIVYRRYSPTIISELPKELAGTDLQKLVKRTWDYKVERRVMPNMFLSTFSNFVGSSMQTSTSVSRVFEFKKQDPERYNRIISGIAKEDEIAASALKAIDEGGGVEYNLSLFGEAFENGRLLTKKLGELSGCDIEPDDLSAYIEETKKNGAFVSKLPGSGGRDALACLCKNKEDYLKLKRFLERNNGLQILDISLKNDGFRIE